MKPPLATEIEELVRAREAAAAHRRIRAFLRRRDRKPGDVFLAAEWYRRLGLFREGFGLLEPKEAILRPLSTARTDGRRLLYACRFLNLMGASEFALALVPTLRPASAEAWRVVGQVQLDNFRPADALPSFARAEALETEPASHAARMGRIARADALSSLGRQTEARRELQSVEDASPETLVRAICHEARAETFAREGDFVSARRELAAAEPGFPAGDASPDRGYLLKWQGYVEGKLGRPEASAECFARALALLKQPQYRAEAWIDVLRLQGELGQLDADTRRRLPWYPGLAAGLMDQIRRPEGPGPVDLGPGPLVIDLARDEYETAGGARAFGIPQELRLLAYVQLAGGWGITLERLKSLLWPQQVYAYTQLESRLHKLLSRLRRKYRVALQVREGMTVIPATAPVRVRVARVPLRPSFLVGRGDFRAREVELYYGLRKTQRAALLKDWRARGWIEARGALSSPALVYGVVDRDAGE